MLRKSQKRELLKIVTQVAGGFVRKMVSREGWTAKEVSQACGVSQNRLTEYKSIEKYQRVISENDLARMIGGGILTVDNIIEGTRFFKPTLDADELAYLDTFRYYENKDLQDKFIEVSRAGGDPVAILDAWLKNK